MFQEGCIFKCRSKKRIFFLLCLIFLFSLASCTRHTIKPKGTWHVLAPGETLEELSRKYAVPIDDIKRANDIFDPRDLSPGQNLYIPTPERIEVPKLKTATAPLKTPKTRFSWPSQGTISSGYGVRHGKMHQGLDITRDKGRDIRAAASGIVHFAGKRNGYGNTIIINHDQGFKTLYAHNAKLYVKKGMKVKRGAIIARMGSSGKSTGIHLHFEILRRGKPQNPLRYLPVR